MAIGKEFSMEGGQNEHSLVRVLDAARPLSPFTFFLISFIRHFSLILDVKKENLKHYIVENFKPELK